MKRRALKVICVLLGGIVSGYLLLVFVFCLPVGRISDHVSGSLDTFRKEGDYNTLIDKVDATTLDNYTDALMLSIAKYTDTESPFLKAVHANFDSRENQTPVETLIANNGGSKSDYSRYWHGYLLFLKPMLLFFDYSEIRIFISIFVISAIAFNVFLLQKKKMNRFIVPYIASMVVIFPVSISLSMQFLSIFAISNIALSVMMMFFERVDKDFNYGYFFLIIGMLTCYFDFLTYPIVTLGLPLIFFMLLKNTREKRSIAENIRQIIVCCLMWALGYFGIWIGKWAIGSLISGENLFMSAMTAADSRTSMIVFGETISRFSGVSVAFAKLFSKPLICIIFLMVFVGVVLFLGKKIRINIKKAISSSWLLVLAFLPIVWYIALANHSTIHAFFTYRSLSVFVLALGCFICNVIEKEGKRNDR